MAYAKTTGPDVFIKAWIGNDEDQIEEAFRKEASRQVGEMERWMKFQKKSDPEGTLWYYEENHFPIVRKALQYRMRIYNRNRVIDKIKFKIIEATVKKDAERIEDLQEEWLTVIDEQIALCWRIKRVYCKVSREVNLNIKSEDEDDPFKEYVYDPEKS